MKGTNALATVWVTTEFAGFHSWPVAPEKVAFLRAPHRHIFKVKASVWVDHDDRDVEFFILKEKVDNIIESCVKPDLKYHSCEMIARNIGENLQLAGYRVRSVEVSEDGENGSLVEL